MKRIKTFIPIHLILQYNWTCYFIESIHFIENKSNNYRKIIFTFFNSKLIVFLLMTVAIAWIRVVSGVHFISDVVAGFLFAAFFSLFF